MNRKQRRSLGVLPQRAFERELRRAVDGDPAADPSVAAFWGHFARTGGIVAAYVEANGDVSYIRNNTRSEQ
ncbi:hypothetical protein [Gordonia alkaliphila]|uniref:Uncharacterized protein n=1 Tax=Gordonia alkaliphila TaxID=1053547 RepID=A0ABP8ZI70_9ACTN